jgi:tetratricopeptide (TPR) repeat protein
MGNLANLYMLEGKFAKAESLLTQALPVLESQLSAYPSVKDRYLENVRRMAKLDTMRGKYDDARKLLNELMAARTQEGERSFRTAEVLLDLSDLDLKTGALNIAESLARQARSIFEQSSGPRNPQACECKVIEAECSARQGKFAHAERLLADLAQSQQALPDNLDSAHVLSNLAQVYTYEHRYLEAESLFNRARSIAAKLAPEGWLMAQILRDLGNLYTDQAKYDQAESIFKQSLTLREQIFGADHPEVAETLESLGSLYIQQGKFSDAEKCINRALDVLKASVGHDNADFASALFDLAMMHLRQRKFEEAGRILKEVLAIRLKVLPQNHPEIASTMKELAALCRDAGELHDAETFYRQLLTADELALGKDSPAVASDLDNLAQILAAQKRITEGRSLTNRSSEIKTKLPGAAVVSGVTEMSAEPSAADKPIKEKWALCIGISNFKDPTINLKYAAKDATDLHDFLVSSGQFKADHVKLLRDQQATRANIVALLSDEWLSRVAGPDDLVLIYVSSHGSAAMNDYSGANFLVAYDTSKTTLPVTGIPMQWLNRLLIDQVHGARVVLILDVCHSGAATEEGVFVYKDRPEEETRIAETVSGFGQGVDNKNVLGADGKGIIREVTKPNSGAPSVGSGQIVMCSSLPQQVSWESKQYPNSVFTRSLIEGLQSNGNKTTLSEAFQVMRQRVENEVLRDRGVLQTPVVKKRWTGADPVM